MELSCTPCMKNIESQLEGLPQAWKEQIAAFVCNSILEASLVNCDQVKECQTVTELSDFEVNGTEVCIKYTDELGVQVTRCFNFEDVINNSMNDVDPQCLMTVQDWQTSTIKERWDAVIAKVCETCEETTTSTSTTTTTSSTSTTTSTTTGAPSPCHEYEANNPTEENQKLFYTPCGLTPIEYDLPAGETLIFCAEQSPVPSYEDCGTCTITDNGECTSGLFTIQNASLSVVVTIEDVTPHAIYSQTGGNNFDLLDGDIQNAIHNGFINTPIAVTIGTTGGGFGITIAIRLYKNGVLQECIQTSSVGVYTFAAIDATSSDDILVIVNREPCE